MLSWMIRWPISQATVMLMQRSEAAAHVFLASLHRVRCWGQTSCMLGEPMLYAKAATACLLGRQVNHPEREWHASSQITLLHSCHRQHGMARQGTAAWHATAWLSMTPHSNLPRHSTAQHGLARHSMAQQLTSAHCEVESALMCRLHSKHSTAQHSTAQRGTAQHSTAQHSAAQHSS